ncbi:ribosomal RNA-processing protein 17 [Oryza brachyantha]|uniref:Ribosomal RNA-processing protein 17 n=1 Tax=Oryza brachyantha TaxID=4533 RepID=J3LNT9_ORYBR|nr:ribosomal RNA-processing protein 17 [Oryza brachyantha]
MAWEEEEAVEEEYGEEMEGSGSEAEDVVVGQMPTVMVPKHIKKRSLKNKALSVSLDKKALKDFVTGFHKRKKKRRKEAQKILQEKERRKRIEERKRRKQEKEIALYGRVLSSDNADGEDFENDGDEMETDDLPASEVRTYEDGGTKITVTTSEITHEEDDDDLGPKRVAPASTSYASKSPGMAAKKSTSLGVKKKPSKRTFRNKSKSKRGDKKKGAAAKGKQKNRGRK